MHKDVIFLGAAVLIFIGACATIERRRPSAKEAALIAVLAALAALGRVPFAGLPGVQPTTFLVIVSGAVFGSAIGGITGATAALVSNIFLGHGPWTFFQMIGWGACGVSAGLFARLLPNAGARCYAVFGAVWGFLFGGVMNFWYWFAFAHPLTLNTWKTGNRTCRLSCYRC